MWVGREGSTVSIKEIASYLGMSAVVKALGADAFRSLEQGDEEQQFLLTASPQLRSWLTSRVCNWHSQIDFNSRNGAIIWLGLSLSPKTHSTKATRNCYPVLLTSKCSSG